VALHCDAFRRAGPFNVSLRRAEDWEMWIRLAKQGPPAWVPEPLMAYRYHSTNMSLDVDAMMRRCDDRGAPPDQRRLRTAPSVACRVLPEDDADGRALGQLAARPGTARREGLRRTSPQSYVDAWPGSSEAEPTRTSVGRPRRSCMVGGSLDVVGRVGGADSVCRRSPCTR
jgi:hypothetical protein